MWRLRIAIKHLMVFIPVIRPNVSVGMVEDGEKGCYTVTVRAGGYVPSWMKIIIDICDFCQATSDEQHIPTSMSAT